jgi:hypothetical protein
MMLQKTIPRPAARPAFDLFRFLAGRTVAHGVFEDRFGKLRRSFTVEIEGKANDGVLTLEEDFIFSDGTTDHRLWRLEKTAEDRFTAICGDTLAPADGRIGPEQCEMSYKIMLDIGSRQLAVRFDDVFYPLDDTTMINRATVTKLGFRLGQTIIVLSKLD